MQRIVTLTRFEANGTRFRRKTAPARSFLPSSSAYTRSAEKPGIRLSEYSGVDVGVQWAVLTCNALGKGNNLRSD